MQHDFHGSMTLLQFKMVSDYFRMISEYLGASFEFGSVLGIFTCGTLGYSDNSDATSISCRCVAW